MCVGSEGVWEVKMCRKGVYEVRVCGKEGV